jgi:DNA-binding PadR family transcriptional regulator
MYELIVLSQLIRWPMHGYLIVKVTNDIIGPWAKISSGTLSTIMKRMEQMGLIVALPQEGDAARGVRRAHTFAITEEGRKRFHQLMMDTSSNLGDYQKIFHYKMGYFDLLRPDERLLLMNHYINYCQAVILHVQTEQESLVYELADHPNPAYLENVARTMKHIVQQWQAERDWMISVREQELARAEPDSREKTS